MPVTQMAKNYLLALCRGVMISVILDSAALVRPQAISLTAIR